MYDLHKIRATISTGRGRGSGTDGTVYLGLAGREFCCDTSHDDFETGSTREYVFTFEGNVRNWEKNTPENPPLDIADVDLFPAYIRFAQGGGSEWCLEEAAVRINDEVDPRYVTRIENNPIWLGNASGCIYYLRKPKPRRG